jgi:hypothetical protein
MDNANMGIVCDYDTGFLFELKERCAARLREQQEHWNPIIPNDVGTPLVGVYALKALSLADFVYPLLQI